MLRRAVVAAPTGVVVAGFLGRSVLADSESVSFDYHVGDAFLAALNPAFSPAKAMAPNGDIIEVVGTGTLSLHKKSVTGGGTFTHKTAAGTVVGSGTWTATQLLGFKSYGSSPVLPPALTAGLALIRVHLVASGGAPSFDGTLRITCVLPEVRVPGGAEEGIRLSVSGALNFNQEAGGATVFVRQS
ncbi:MAG: hypothetical protein HY332_18010 [Chloroflexi bacterium]|nr:hypothetical protein [Chloroflexota bacterium]